MNFTTENDFESMTIDVNGTCLQGQINCDYDDLVKCFGEPADLSTIDSDGKVDVEWVIEFEDGTVATVYNWKNGPLYCGDEGIPVQAIKRWHIGGKSYKAQDHVITAVTISKATSLLTLKQEQSIALLKTRWSTVGDPTPLPCDDCVMVRVSSDSTGVSMVLGIEADGHIHS